MLCFCLGCAAGTQAQVTIAELRKMPVEQKAVLLTDSLQQLLHLSQQQHVKVYSVVLNGVKNAVPVAQGNGDRLDKAIKLKAILNDTEKQLKEVVSKEQWQLFLERKQDMLAYYKNKLQQLRVSFTVPE